MGQFFLTVHGGEEFSLLLPVTVCCHHPYQSMDADEPVVLPTFALEFLVQMSRW